MRIGEGARVGEDGMDEKGRKRKITVLGGNYRLEDHETVEAGEMLEAK